MIDAYFPGCYFCPGTRLPSTAVKPLTQVSHGDPGKLCGRQWLLFRRGEVLQYFLSYNDILCPLEGSAAIAKPISDKSQD